MRTFKELEQDPATAPVNRRNVSVFMISLNPQGSDDETRAKLRRFVRAVFDDDTFESKYLSVADNHKVYQLDVEAAIERGTKKSQIGAHVIIRCESDRGSKARIKIPELREVADRFFGKRVNLNVRVSADHLSQFRGYIHKTFNLAEDKDDGLVQ